MRRLSFALKRLVPDLLRNTRGTSAVEFALLLPFMLFLLIGSVEISDALNQDRKVSRISNTIVDLVAQDQIVNKTKLKGYFDAGEAIIEPFSSATLNIVVASVSFDNKGNASIDWAHGSKSSAGWSKGSKPPMTLPSGVAKPNTSIVVSEVTSTFTPRFGGLLSSSVFKHMMTKDADFSSPITLSEQFYLQPRVTNTVQCTNC